MGAVAVGLDGGTRVVTWAVVQITYANLAVIVLMLVVFVLALLLPFPRRRR
ncbi:MAG: hypothetical protein ACTHOD_02380 [Motilibacteraceae bacterium]